MLILPFSHSLPDSLSPSLFAVYTKILYSAPYPEIAPFPHFSPSHVHLLPNPNFSMAGSTIVASYFADKNGWNISPPLYGLQSAAMEPAGGGKISLSIRNGGGGRSVKYIDAIPTAITSRSGGSGGPATSQGRMGAKSQVLANFPFLYFCGIFWLKTNIN